MSDDARDACLPTDRPLSLGPRVLPWGWLTQWPSSVLLSTAARQAAAVEQSDGVECPSAWNRCLRGAKDREWVLASDRFGDVPAVARDNRPQNERGWLPLSTNPTPRGRALHFRAGRGARDVDAVRKTISTSWPAGQHHGAPDKPAG